MAAILNFRIFAKMKKHKFASISLTVQDRAISSKFSTHRVSEQLTLCNFQKNEAEIIDMYTKKYLSIIDIFYK